ncbi:hypothetical protein AB2890_23690, partial [Escherichia coli]
EWVHVQLHQQKGMISLSPPTICNSAVLGTASVLLILLAVVVWFTLPERKIRQLGKQRATPH